MSVQSLVTSNYHRHDDASQLGISSVDHLDTSINTRNAPMFGNNGLYYFIVNTTTGVITRYTCGTAYDIETVVYTDERAVNSRTDCFTFSNDGLELYVWIQDTGYYYMQQWTLSTAWLLSSATYTGVNVTSMTTYCIYVEGMAISPDGTRMITADSNKDRIATWSMSPAYDITSIAIVGSKFVSNPYVMHVDSDGLTLYISRALGSIEKYTTTVAWNTDVANITLAQTSPKLCGGGFGFVINNTRDKMYISTGIVNTVAGTLKFELEISEDVTSARGISTDFLSTYWWIDSRFVTARNGSNIYITSWSTTTATRRIYQYALTADGRLQSAYTYDKIFDPTIEVLTTACRGIEISSTGHKLYVMNSDDILYQYSLGTDWDISTAVYDSVATDLFTIAGVGGSYSDPRFSADGTKLFILSDTTNVVYRFTLSTAWLVSSASYGGTAADALTCPQASTGIAFNDDGTALFIAGATGDIDSYELATPYDLSTGTHLGTFETALFNRIEEPSSISCHGGKVILNELDSNMFYQFAF